MRRGFALAAAALLLALVGAACATGDGAKRAAGKPTTSTTKPPPPVAPLTGLPDPSGVSRTRPALWVKIENLPVARPQSGLEQADVVYEIVINGGITRFAAVFQSTSANPIGPIRSVRPMDPQLVQPLDGIFAYSGGIDEEIQRINAVPNLHTINETGAGDAMFRISSRDAPHNLYGNTDAFWAQGGQPAPPPPLFNHLGKGATCAGDSVTSLTIPFDPLYGQPAYTWDPGSASWQRSYDGSPHVMDNGRQIAPTNVIVQFVDYTPEPGVDGGDATLTGQGDAWVLCGGKLARGRWVRPDVGQPARFVDAAGKPLALAPGRTWVELVPTGSNVAVVAPPPPPPPPTTTTTKPKKK